MVVVLSFVLSLACFAGCADPVPGTGGGNGWNTADTPLSEKLTEYGFSGMTDLSVGKFTSVGVESAERNGALSLSTNARTVSHGNIYTAYVNAPITGDINEGDTIIVRFAVKNEGQSATNFLVDLYKNGDASRDTWLTRHPVFSPEGEEYTEYYFYAVADEDSDAATFEMTIGWAAQSFSLDFVQAAKYPGTLRESILEKLPLMSRQDDSGNEVWYTYYASNASWRTQAAEMIEANRKGGLTVNVKDADGAPVAGATVKVEMIEHDYHFGTASSANAFLGENADENYAIINDFFNIVTFANDLKWGDPNFKGVGTQQETLEALEYLAEKGMDVHGHVLFWGGGGRDPYDDGVDNTAEFVTSPPFVVSTARVLHALMRMQHVKTPYGYEAGFGDGTIGTLREEVNDAIAVCDEELLGTRNPDALTIKQHQTIRGMLIDLRNDIASLDDAATTFAGLEDAITSLRAALRTIILEHVADYADYYGQAGSIVEWDVINEAMNAGNRTIQNALGEDAYMNDKSKICQDQIYVDILKTAREAAGDIVKLSYNDVSWQSNGQQRADTYNFFKYLYDNEAPIDFFGMQAYMYPQSIRAMITPEQMWEEYDRFLALGIETEITEYDPQGFEDLLGSERTRMLEADFTYDYILANFAHEGSIGFIGWGGLPTSGPVSSVYYKLVYDELWTNEEALTGTQGSASVDAFLGSYRITVTLPNGQSKTVTVDHLNASSSGEGTVVDVQF